MITILSLITTSLVATHLRASSNDVVLAGFEAGEAGSFKVLNDPVMGGKSTGTFSKDSSGSFGIFDGSVVDVPKLKAPGFLTIYSDGPFSDASKAIGGDLVLRVRSSTPTYTGFKASFAAGTVSPTYSCAGGGGLPFSRGCFKASFMVPPGDDFTDVRIPFNQFSDKWDSATGKLTKTCAEDTDVCPTAKKLGKILRLEIWAEGAAGDIHLEFESVSASSVASRLASTPQTAMSPPSLGTVPVVEGGDAVSVEVRVAQPLTGV